MTEDTLTRFIHNAMAEGWTELDLSRHQLSALPTEVYKLEGLTRLILSENALTEIPSGIRQLRNLTVLNLNGNLLTSMPSEIAELHNLKALTLSGNNLSTLPPETGELRELAEISLDHNQLTSLPKGFGNLQQLTTLDLNSNRLGTIPTELCSLRNLTNLDLGGNQLRALPPEIGELQNLTGLSVGNNLLSAIPAEIGKLGRLTQLVVSRNQLTSLPWEIGDLANLESLIANGNRLTALPHSIVQLRNLRSLILNGNKLVTLPPEISQLKNLRTLHLDSNQLAALPPELGGLESLAELQLGGNQLTELPAEIGQLRNLRALSLDSNQLGEFPAGVTRLSNLNELLLGGNQLRLLPSAVSRLKKLTIFYIDNNQLDSIPPEIGQLQMLTELLLGGNLLRGLPGEIGQLQNLRVLALEKNQLTEVPQEMGSLKNLRALSLEGNQLTGLPPALGLLHRDVTLNFDNNPWREPFSTLVSSGTETILAYIRSLSDAVPHYEAKLLLVGEGNVGKTSLLAALGHEPFLERRETTHGIQMRSLMVKHPDFGTPITLNAWDFGGQEIYRVTHQFFFSRRSLYLLVWNPREGREENAIEDWLKRIKLRVNDARVIIVATHCAERHPELDYAHLRSRFGEVLVGYLAVDSKTGEGIEELEQTIAQQAAKLSHMGELLNRHWIEARDEVLRWQQPQITRNQFAEICRKHKLSEQEIDTLLTLLNDLGNIIYYGDEEGLRDIVVLQPEWLTKAIGYVFEDRPTLASKGVLDHSRLKKIWYDNKIENRTKYNPEYHPYFLRLMEKFDISFRVADQSKSLVAQLAPYERPTLPWEVDSPLPRGHRELSLYCSMEEEPPGLIAWLTVRNHRFSTGRHWRRGAFLAHQEHEALVELDSVRRLFLSVRGSSPGHFFSLLRDSLEYLVRLRWPGLTYELESPCATRDPAGVRCAGRFKFASLLKARERGFTTFPCATCLEPQDVGVLLTGFSDRTGPVQQKLDEIIGELRQSRRDQSQISQSIRRVLAAISTETRECPRLFTLFPVGGGAWDPRQLGKAQYKLQLWCEQPQQEHPLEAGEYAFSKPREWLVRITPFARLVAKTLKIAVPLAGPLLGMVADEVLVKSIKPQLEFMETLTSELLAGDLEATASGSESTTGLTSAEGAGLRELHTLLVEVDPSRAWGKLKRVLTTAGDYLWVCPEHYHVHDPGLPILAARSS